MKRSLRRASRCALLASIEQVEPRRLLAELIGSQLVIDTTDNDVRNNRVLVETVGDTLVVTTNRSPQRFPAADVASIVAHLGAGNDKIQISPNVNLPTTLDGGAGNDTILAGPNADSILGGDGDDHIRPGLGNDTVDGGLGTDEVSYAERMTAINGVLRAYVRPAYPPFPPFEELLGVVNAAGEMDTTATVETLTGSQADDQLRIYMAGYVSGSNPSIVARLNGGEGNDQFEFGGYFSGIYEAINTIADGGNGNDTFGLAYAAERLTILGGAGDDTVRTYDDDTFTPHIFAGDGVDLFISNGLILSNGPNSDYTMPTGLENLIAFNSHASMRIIGNELANVITAAGYTVYVDGAGGNDSITRTYSYPTATLIGGTGDDTLTVAGASDGNSILDGGIGNDLINGGEADDSISAGDGDDTIHPGLGNDTVDAGAGYDELSYANRTTPIEGRLDAHVFDVNWGVKPYLSGTVTAHGEQDRLLDVETLTGSAGNDTLSLFSTRFVPGAASNSLLAKLNGAAGDDQFWFEGYWSFGYYGIDAIADGGAGHDHFYYRYPAWQLTLLGGDGNDTMRSDDDDVASAPTFYPGDGVDTYQFSGLSIAYTMPEGLENCTVTYANSTARIIGNDSPNVISVSAGYHGAYVEGRGGDDQITTSYPAANATLLGGEGNDTLIGSDGLANDFQTDLIDGGEGDDYLDGRGGADSILAGDGDDTIHPGLGNDTIDGGLGRDELSYGDRTTPIDGRMLAVRITSFPPTFTVINGSINAPGELDTFKDAEVMTGGSGNDTLTAEYGGYFGSLLPNEEPIFRLNGGIGDDSIQLLGRFEGSYLGFNTVADGGEGNDYFFDRLGGRPLTILGGAGNDTIEDSDSDVFPPTIDAGEGIDFYQASAITVHYTMPSGLENMRATLFADVRIEGNELPNIIEAVGSFGTYVDGRGGDDLITRPGYASRVPTLLGGDGNDTIRCGDGTQLDDGVDSIDGGPGDDYLDGGGGADSIYGGTGTDTAVRDPNDAVVDSIEIFVGGRKTKRARFNVDSIGLLV